MADMNEIDKRFDIHEIAKNKRQDLDRFVCNIYCCHSTGCKSSGSDDILDLLKSAVAEHGLEGKVRIVATGCMDYAPRDRWYESKSRGKKTFFTNDWNRWWHASSFPNTLFRLSN